MTPTPTSTPTPTPTPTATPVAATAPSEEIFLGKQAGWADLRVDYGARGDGTTDDSAALQRALDDLGTSGKSAVLYIPVGVYRITRTVNLTRKLNVSIIGEDPATTILDWAGTHNDGPDYTVNGGTMLLGQGSAQIKIGRLTFDGHSKLNFGLRWRWAGNGSQDLFPTGNQHFDLVFKDMDVGIGAGCGQCSQQDTAEYSHIYRTQFIRCSYGGLYTEDFNSLLWGIVDSYFEDNAVGVRLALGNAAIYDSTFVRSKTSDVVAETIPIVSVRGSRSIGSARFVTATGNTGTVTLQNNTVIDPTSTAVDTGSPVLTLIGNSFRTGSAPAVMLRNAAALAAGNRFSGSTGFATQGASPLRELDDSNGATIADAIVARPVAPSQYSGTIVTPAAFTGAAVQAAIDQLAAGSGGLVYLRTGTYNVDSTITVPAGKDIRLVGDGTGRTLLIAANPATASPVLRLAGPSHATVQDLSLHGGYNATPTADELSITNADQAGGAVITYGLLVVGPNTSGRAFDVNGLDDSTAEFLLTHYAGGRGETLNVTGGPNAASRSGANVRIVDGFPGVSGGTTAPTFRVSNGGRLIALDQWAEVQSQNLFEINDSGNFTLSGGAYIFAAPTGRPLITANSFSGRVTLLGALFGNTDLTVLGGNANSNLLLATSRLDGWSQGSNAVSRLIDSTTAGTVRQYLSPGATYNATQAPNAGAGAVTDAWLRTMLADVRNDSSRRNTLSTSAAVTAVQLRRLSFESGNTALRISR